MFRRWPALAAAAGYRLDRSPHDPRDLVSLQAGARTYVNYCLGCHGMQYMRYKGLTELGLTEAQIRDNLLFTADKVGEPMKVALDPKDGKAWFGVAPPDLSVVGALARRRLALHLPAHLLPRPEDRRPGWNNAGVSRTSPCRTRCGRCRASAAGTRRSTS